MNKLSWLSTYIYTDSPDELLVNNILPIVKYLKKEKLVHQYFFIRYNDRTGFHIRFRVKGNKENLDTIILPILKKTFPPCRVVSYRRELNRYGGKFGVEIAESIFESSSRVILSFLNDKKHLTYDSKLIFSMQLTVSMMHAFGISKLETLLFFKHISKIDNNTFFKKELNIEKTNISPFISRLWSDLDQKSTFDKSWFNDWINELTILGEILLKNFNDNKLIPLDPMHKHSSNPLWYLYESYIHMNNNRLGIYLIDEPYLANLLIQSFGYEG